MVQVAGVVAEHRRRILALLPSAAVCLTGGALVEDDPDDVDLVALVDDVAAAAGRLREAYAPLHEGDWRDDWAAFRDPGPPQVDVVVTRPGSEPDARHRRAWELLAGDPALLAEYRALKETRERYEERKRAFFERVAATLS